VKSFSSAWPSRRPEDGEFLEPTWTEDVSLERYLEACPAHAETLGTFFAHVRQHVIDALGALPDEFFEGVSKKSWLPFRSYPLRDFMRVAYAAARLAYPNLSRSDGLRRIGWRSYPSFAATMAGRVVLFALGDELDDVVRASPKAYRLGLPGCSVEVTRVGERHYRYEMRDVHSFVDSYHYGVLEGAILAFKHRPDIRLRRLDRLCDAEFEVRWT
jgi:uncharacterized protein (TIGR02265 family)